MTDTYYPTLPEGAVWAVDIVLQNSAEDAEYLANSPYSSEEIQILARISAEKGDFLEEFEVNETKWQRMERISNELFKELLEEKANLNVKDSAEKMSFFRTATSLLDKIVGIQERAANLKQIHIFHDTVLRIMEEVLDAGQRTEALERLKASIQTES